MPYELFLALRHLSLRRGRRGAARVTALAAVVGIACGVAALIVATALANGFRDELQDKILRGTAHLTVGRADGSSITDWRARAAQLRGVEGVVETAATTYAGALLSGPGGVAYAVLRGVDPESPGALAAVRGTLVEGTPEDLFRAAGPPGTLVRGGMRAAESGPATRPPGADPGAGDEKPVAVIIGAELAGRTGLARVGEEGWIITGEAAPGSPGFVPRARRVRVAGVFRSGLYEYDASWVYLPLAAAGEMAGGASVISVEIEDIYDTEATAARVGRSLGQGWTVVDWREANRPL
ncbi:MAG: ABC transporter permease, partial [Pyrinomonadaceae bacterium]